MIEKKQSKKGWLFSAIIVLIIVTVIAIGVPGDVMGSKNPVSKISTPYIDLVLPLELETLITNDESTYNNVYTYGFYMNYGGDELPLWRVDFGDLNAGDWVGMLVTDKGNIPVTMTGFIISAEELSALGEEGSLVYGECMQAYSVMLEGIMSDPRFTPERPLAVGEDRDIELTYWTVTLPDTMKVSENMKGDNYEAVFYAEVAGESVRLYQICIGEEQSGSLLGYFEVDGAKKFVTVESYDLAERGDWTADDYAAAYRMMDTINDVIQQIMSSERFSEN